MNQEEKTKAALIEELDILRKENISLQNQITKNTSGSNGKEFDTEKIIARITQQIISYTGDQFFEKIVLALGKELRVDFSFVGKITEDILTKEEQRTIETVYLNAKNNIVSNFSYQLNDTPCDNVFGKDLCIYSENVQSLFPEDHLLKEMGIESYAGLPLFTGLGKPIGILVVLDSKKLENEKLINSVLSFFADRISSELERLLYVKKLQESEKRFSQVTENSDNWVWEINTEGLYTYSSSSVEKMLEYKPEEVVGKKYFYDLFAEVDRDQLKAEAFKGFDERRFFKNFINKNRSKKGKEIWISTTAVPILDEANNFIGYRGTNHNITDQILDSQTIEIKDAALNYSLNAIAISSLDGKLIFVNQSFLKMWGYKNLIDVVGMQASDFWLNKEQALEIQNSLINQSKWEGDLIAKRKDNSTFITHLGASVLTETLGEPLGMIATFIDVTRDRKINEALDIALHLNTKLADSSVQEVLQFGLEECEKITESNIGYFHFVNDDQETIDLQLWTDNTMKWCEVKEKETHYPVSKAGIWVDCLRQRRTIITNDYENHPHKKCLPEGHAAVIREIDVPVFEGDKVTAIIGLGNKKFNYTDLDVEIVQIIADSVWSIVRRKRIESNLREMEERSRIQFLAIPVPTYIWEKRDNDFYFLDCNEAATVTVGKKIKDLYGKPLSEIYKHREDIIDDIHKCFNTKTDINKVMNYQTTTGINKILDVKYVYISPNMVMVYTDDITKEKIAQEELTKEKEFTETAINALQDTFFVFDPKTGKALRWNKAFTEISGYTDEEISEMIAPNDWYSEDDLKKTETKLGDIYNTEHFTVQIELITKSGERIPTEYSASLIKDNDGNPTHIISVGRDITERKLAEEKLRMSEEKLSLIFNSSTNLLALFKINGNHKIEFETVNKELVDDNKKSGILLEHKDYVGLDVKKYLKEIQKSDDERIELIINNINDVIKSKGIKNYEDSFLMNDGRKAFLDISFIPIIEKGLCERVLYIGKDITGKKLAEKALKLSEEKFRRVVENAQAIIFTIDKDGVFTLSEGKGLRRLGLVPNQIVGQSVFDIYKDFPEIIKNVKTVLNGKVVRSDVKLKDLIYDTYYTPMYDLVGKIDGLIGIAVDITEKVKAEKELDKYRKSLEILVNKRTSELEKVNKQLAKEIIKQKEAELKVTKALQKEKDLNELKTRFISTASHEFRTPLTSILTSAEILEMFGVECSESEFNEQIQRIINSVEYLTKLMDDVLTMSITDSGKIQFAPKLLDFHQLCSDVIDDIKLNVTDMHELVFEYKASVREFNLDEKLLKFIIQNLLSNAVKYSPEGGKILFKIEHIDNMLRIIVSDTGLGIPLNCQKHLFEPFHRAVNTRELPGTGLGLSIVKKSVELHNGSISFKSIENKGTTFTVNISTK